MSQTPTKCPVCTSSDTTLFEHRADCPVMMHRVYATREEARACPRGDLELWRCRNCGFVWNRAFDPELIQYDDEYENDQMNSPVFAAHVADRAGDIIAAAPAGGSLDYLEVGCGQGHFISMVETRAAGRMRSAEGFDPAWRGEDKARLGRARIHKSYFNGETARLVSHPPNVVASRHTIEHVPDPVVFLTAIRGALGPDSQARLFIETPCIDWIIANQAMQDLFYEHCSIFTARALHIAFSRSGFTKSNVDHVFSGQYLWGHGEAGAASDLNQSNLPPILPDKDVAADYVSQWQESIEKAAGEGPVAIWGAGAKGVTFALLIDRDARHIDHVIDINPAKQNRYIAGSGLQVLAPEDAAKRNLRNIFVMNPNYMDEISKQANELGIDARLIAVN